MKLETERLILRECELNDSQNLLSLFTEKHVRVYDAYMPSDVNGVKNYIKRQIENIHSNKRTHFNFILRLKETEEFIGVAGFSFVEDFIYELEYFACEKHWNNGYMTEVVKRILEFARLNIDKIKTVYAICQTENKGSERVMIKCGMNKSIEQPKPKEYHGVYKERVKYEINFY